MKYCHCSYCMGDNILAGFAIKICGVSTSQLILFKDQSIAGRVIVAYKEHISDKERNAFFADIARTA